MAMDLRNGKVVEPWKEKKGQGNTEKVIQEENKEKEVEKDKNRQFKKDDRGTSKKKEDVNALKLPFP